MGRLLLRGLPTYDCHCFLAWNGETLRWPPRRTNRLFPLQSPFRSGSKIRDDLATTTTPPLLHLLIYLPPACPTPPQAMVVRPPLDSQLITMSLRGTHTLPLRSSALLVQDETERKTEAKETMTRMPLLLLRP